MAIKYSLSAIKSCGFHCLGWSNYELLKTISVSGKGFALLLAVYHDILFHKKQVTNWGEIISYYTLCTGLVLYLSSFRQTIFDTCKPSSSPLIWLAWAHPRTSDTLIILLHVPCQKQTFSRHKTHYFIFSNCFILLRIIVDVSVSQKHYVWGRGVSFRGCQSITGILKTILS